MENETKFMNVTQGTVFELEKILNYLVKHNQYSATIDNTRVIYKGTYEDTYQGKRQIFEIQRKVEE